MIQKLTANLKKSEDYGVKIQDQLRLLGAQILQVKIQTSKVQQRTSDVMRQMEELNIAIKRQDEQSSSYEYKKQKLEIRMKEYNRKLVLQQQIYNKKLQYQESLKYKIQNIENSIKQSSKEHETFHTSQQHIDHVNLKINKQIIAIENLYIEMMAKNKIARIKQDELHSKKKSNLKKKAMLERLNNSIHSDQNKQNLQLNVQSARETDRMCELEKDKLKIDRKIKRQVDEILSIFGVIQQMSDCQVSIKKQMSKFDEIVNEVKNQKNGLLKLKNNYDNKLSE